MPQDPPQACWILGLTLAAASTCERPPATESRAPALTQTATETTASSTPPTGQGAGPSDAAPGAHGRSPPAITTAASQRCSPDFPVVPREVLALLGPIEDLVFEGEGATIQPQSHPTLDHIVDVLLRHPHVDIEIRAHSDDDPVTRNQAKELTQRQAESVLNYLVVHGVEPTRLLAHGYGPTMPRAANDSPAQRALNRRVDLHAPALDQDTRLCLLKPTPGTK